MVRNFKIRVVLPGAGEAVGRTKGQFPGAAALQADEVVVVLTAEVELKAPAAVPKEDLMHQTQLSKSGKGPVNCIETDSRVALPHLMQDFLGA
jgi:hypothetical protein